jgi:hypothetical protein
MPHDLENLVLYLLEQGSKTDAVRLYQEETGAQHAEAKRAVKDLARRHGLVSTVAEFADLILLALMLISLLLGIIYC